MVPLALIVSRKLASGLLPRETPDKLVAGYGDGSACSVCELPILASQVEWSFREDRSVEYRFHLGCFGLWEAACRRRGWRRPGVDASGDDHRSAL